MESYQQRNILLEEKHGRLIHVNIFNDEVLKNNNNEQYAKQIADMTDGEGLKLAYETRYGLYQHYNKLFIAGTKDWPGDAIDDPKLPFDDI